MNPSINALKASDGSGNASVVTIQNARSPGATTIQGDTVQGINTDFFGTMGTPHTFTDPVTGETITVVSEATAVDFRGHVDGSNLEIDEIAPGYTDAGSSVGDIVIVRPTTQWADNIASVLGVSLNDDGSLKAVTENPGWTALAYTPDTVTYLGNRSYECVFNSVDLTGALSNGMRLRFTRTVAAPTQCTSLNGSNQYWSKSSPVGMTFTDDFVVSAWVKLSSYSGSDMTIVARYNGTSGWAFKLDTSGRLLLAGYNGASTNNSFLRTYQSLPLNKWVHLSAQLDMSAFTATSTTSYAMFDGVEVPIEVVRSGTNPTALVQAGDLQIGARNGSEFFPGKIAQVAIFNAKVTQATMRGYISQGLSGTEPNLISAYSFNNSINNLNTTNANNLTANGGAVATNADAPWTKGSNNVPSGTNDYFIQTAIQYTGGNTVQTVQVPEGCTIPTSGGVSAVVYSSNDVPYLFPKSKKRWYLTTLFRQGLTFALSTSWNSPVGGSLSIPAGSFDIYLLSTLFFANSTTAGQDIMGSLSTSSTAETDADITQTARLSSGSGTTVQGTPAATTSTIDASTATTLYLIGRVSSTSGTSNPQFYNQTVVKLLPSAL